MCKIQLDHSVNIEKGALGWAEKDHSASNTSNAQHRLYRGALSATGTKCIRLKCRVRHPIFVPSWVSNWAQKKWSNVRTEEEEEGKRLINQKRKRHCSAGRKEDKRRQTWATDATDIFHRWDFFKFLDDWEDGNGRHRNKERGGRDERSINGREEGESPV